MSSAGESRRLRPEIQSLRAIAVAAVVIVHIWPQSLTGGYVGVDVFFAISGYLITSHLARELEQRGTINLPAFWARRIRRLFPAAATVLIVCILLLIFVVPPSEAERTANEITASGLIFENWRLAFDSVDYLAASNVPTIVQHYWSLGVEEQFYLVWPVLLLVISFIFRRRKAALFAVIGIGLAVSLAYCILTVTDPASYFNTGARAWQFALGGLLALSGFRVPRRLRMPRIVSLIGYALIAYSVFFYTAATAFPGWHAILPTLGAVLVIAADAPSRVEESFPVQFAGNYSYPIYLWHFPFVVVVPYFTDGIGLRVGIAIIAATVLLAWLTTKFIENPLRFRKASVMRAFVAAAAVTVLVVGGTTITANVQAGANDVAPEITRIPANCAGAAAIVNSCEKPFAVTTDTVNTAYAAKDQGSLALDCSAPGVKVTTCDFGDTKDPEHTVAVIGNSHAGHFMGGLDKYGSANRIHFILMRKTGCTGAIETPVITTNPGTQTDCYTWTRNVIKQIIASPTIDGVVFASNNESAKYIGPLNPTGKQSAQIVANIEKTMKKLMAAGKAVVTFGDTPGYYPTAIPTCVYLHKSEYDPCAQPASIGAERGNFVAQAAQATKGVTYTTVSQYFCDATTCHVVIGGLVAYFDEHHMTNSFSQTLGQYLGPVVSKALAEAR